MTSWGNYTAQDTPDVLYGVNSHFLALSPIPIPYSTPKALISTGRAPLALNWRTRWF